MSMVAAKALKHDVAQQSPANDITATFLKSQDHFDIQPKNICLFLCIDSEVAKGIGDLVFQEHDMTIGDRWES